MNYLSEAYKEKYYEDYILKIKLQHQMVLEENTQTLGPGHPLTLQSLVNLRVYLEFNGFFDDYALAEQIFQRELEAKQKYLGAEHPDTMRVENRYGLMAAAQLKFDLAEPLLTHAFANSSKVLGNDHPETLKVANNLGRVLYRQNKFVEAEKMLLFAVIGLEKVLGPDHHTTLESVKNLGFLYRRVDNPLANLLISSPREGLVKLLQQEESCPA